jgi:hypothetical protein
VKASAQQWAEAFLYPASDSQRRGVEIFALHARLFSGAIYSNLKKQEPNMPNLDDAATVPPQSGSNLPPLQQILTLPKWLVGIIQLGILGGIITIGIWIGKIETSVTENSESLKRIEAAVLDPNTGMSVRLARIEAQLAARSSTSPGLAIDQKQIEGMRVAIERLESQVEKLSTQRPAQ